jgi:glycerol-3-phosphate dehydrogenase
MSSARKNKLDLITADGAFDVLVVGGGINGIGVFRELALQGLRVLLVERNDFCSGCSAAPSRMIHGGLRYLENGEFSLVNESLRERDELLTNAPHLVQSLPTTVPITGVVSGLWNSVTGFLGGGAKPSSRGAVPIEIGLTIYDWLTRKRRRMPRHVFRRRADTHATWPDLDQKVRFSATYFDAWISHPERLGIELIGDAEAASPGSVALNYATIELAGEGRLEIIDSIGINRVPVTAKVIVNATGAWIDETKSTLSSDEKASERLVSGTKGSHLIIDNPALFSGLKGHMLYYENADGRICIAFPYLGRVLVGATDIRVEGASRVRCEDDERDYILESIGRLFPKIPVSASQIVYSYSGIRPLPRSSHAFTGRISRGHFTRWFAGPLPQICMVGGKWTTFRAFAEQTTDEVLAELGASRRCATLDVPIGGGRDFPQDRGVLARDYRERFGVSQARAAHLVDHYGTQGAGVQTHCGDYASDRPLADGCPYTSGEIDYLARNEQVEHLSDLILRRTALAITGGLSDDVIDAAVTSARAVLDWSDEQCERERAALIAELENFHGVPATRFRQKQTGEKNAPEFQSPDEPDVHQRRMPGRSN